MQDTAKGTWNRKMRGNSKGCLEAWQRASQVRRNFSFETYRAHFVIDISSFFFYTTSGWATCQNFLPWVQCLKQISCQLKNLYFFHSQCSLNWSRLIFMELSCQVYKLPVSIQWCDTKRQSVRVKIYVLLASQASSSMRLRTLLDSLQNWVQSNVNVLPSQFFKS